MVVDLVRKECESGLRVSQLDPKLISRKPLGSLVVGHTSDSRHSTLIKTHCTIAEEWCIIISSTKLE